MSDCQMVEEQIMDALNNTVEVQTNYFKEEVVAGEVPAYQYSKAHVESEQSVATEELILEKRDVLQSNI